MSNKLNSKYVLILLIMFMQPGCATKPHKMYSCKALAQWEEKLTLLQQSIDIRLSIRTDTAHMLAPAFNDEIFKPIFGVTYGNLSAKQGDGLWRSMHACNPRGFAQTISGAVTPHKEYYNNKLIWTRSIEEANKTPFNIILKNRKEHIATLKSRMKIASKRRREAINRMQEIRNKKFTDLMETIGKINERAFPDETHDEANNYADYGACAEKLQSRLAHCFVSAGSCDNTGDCRRNSTHCDKGIFGTQCIETVNANAKRHISYYCDIENSRDYNENRKVVINQICSGK